MEPLRDQAPPGVEMMCGLRDALALVTAFDADPSRRLVRELLAARLAEADPALVVRTVTGLVNLAATLTTGWAQTLGIPTAALLEALGAVYADDLAAAEAIERDDER